MLRQSKLLLDSSRLLGPTVFQRPLSTESAANFIASREDYRKQMANLRKKWAEDHQASLDQRAAIEREERRKIVLNRAMSLRVHRMKKARNLETQRLLRDEQLNKYKEKLARTHILWEERQEANKKCLAQAEGDLLAEKEHWITPESFSSVVTPEFFARTPTTTGIVTHTSEFYRHEVFVPSLNRLLSPEFVDDITSMPSSDLQQRQKGFVRLTKRLVVEEFLSRMITNAKDRSNFRSLVEQTTETFEKTGSFDWLKSVNNDTVMTGTIFRRADRAQAAETHGDDIDNLSSKAKARAQQKIDAANGIASETQELEKTLTAFVNGLAKENNLNEEERTLLKRLLLASGRSKDAHGTQRDWTDSEVETVLKSLSEVENLDEVVRSVALRALTDVVQGQLAKVGQPRQRVSTDRVRTKETTGKTDHVRRQSWRNAKKTHKPKQSVA